MGFRFWLERHTENPSIWGWTKRRRRRIEMKQTREVWRTGESYFVLTGRQWKRSKDSLKANLQSCTTTTGTRGRQEKRPLQDTAVPITGHWAPFKRPVSEHYREREIPESQDRQMIYLLISVFGRLAVYFKDQPPVQLEDWNQLQQLSPSSHCKRGRRSPVDTTQLSVHAALVLTHTALVLNAILVTVTWVCVVFVIMTAVPTVKLTPAEHNRRRLDFEG